MARVDLTLTVRKRWFYWPAFVAVTVLREIGVIRSPNAAGRWLVDRAMVFEAR